ncbi:MAG TPA: DegV family protein [Dehalococcoidales bacterium]|jgi:DegV family protein with EDD domain
MPQIAIITDSIACLPRDLREKYCIQIVPLTILVAGQLYHDGVDITPSQVYEMFLKDPNSFKAAPATPEEFLTVLRKAAQAATDIFCITVSLKISTMFNVARLAIERLKVETPGIRIELLDSATATAAEGFIALAAAKAVEAGESLAEVVKAAGRIKEKVNAVVMLDTMRHVYRSGRVPKIAAQAGSMLNIRPIFTVSGSVHFATAVRNKKRGIEKIKSMLREKVGSQPIHCAVMHAYAPDEALRLKEQVAAEFNCVELWTTEFSPVMGYATGTGTLGLAFYAD